MARLGVLFCSSSEQVEEYVCYLLHEMRQSVNHMVVLFQGKTGGNLDRLQAESADCRFMEGAALQDVLKELMQHGSKGYDELLIADDSCYGPLIPLASIQQRMKQERYDLWDIMSGISFLYIGSPVLHSGLFAEFWSTWKKSEAPFSLITWKQRMMNFFSTSGFCCGSYLAEEALSLDPVCDAYQLLAQCGCPFLKKEVLMRPQENVLQVSMGEPPRQVMNYITENTPYDQDLIWQDLLHNCEVGDIRTAFHLDYIFSSRICANRGETVLRKKICLIAHISYTGLIDHCFAYIREVPEEIDIVITTKGQENIEKIGAKIKQLNRSNIRMVVPEDRGREISALLVACRDILPNYEYLGFVHDKKSNKGIPFQTIGQSFMDILWENSIKNSIYIRNALERFEKEPKLGLLSPPVPYMSLFFTVSGVSWSGCYAVTSELAKWMGLNCIMDENKNPFVLGTTFWCRTDALRPLLESGLDYKDFQPEPMAVDGTISHGIERIFPYVAQSQGYYSGIMMTEEYASLYMTNYRYMLGNTIHMFFSDDSNLRYADIQTEEEKLYSICSKYEKVYIYGVGLLGKRCASYIEKKSNIILSGFIVSDGYRKQLSIRSYPVYELSEMTPKRGEGIILALNTKNAKEVIPKLVSHGFKMWERFNG